MNFGQLLKNVIPVAMEGKATGGTTTTLVDTSLVGKLDSDAFKDSILFVQSTTDGLAPVDQFSIVSAFNDDGASPTFTFAPAITAPFQSGDYYQIAAGQYNLYTALRVCNRAIRNMGMVPLNDISLVGTASTTVYALPLALKNYFIERVQIGNNTDGWADFNNYYVTNTAPGSVNSLIFQWQPPYDVTTPSNKTFKLWYRDYHPTLDTYEDVIAESIPEARAIAACKLAFDEEFASKDTDLSDETLKKLQISRAQYSDIESRQRIRIPSRGLNKTLPIRDNGANY